MAMISDVFSHSTPQIFYDEAPPNSTSIGERILDRGIDVVDAIIRARYGDMATIPSGRTDTRTANAQAAILAEQQRQQAAVAGGGIGFLLIALVVLFLIFRR